MRTLTRFWGLKKEFVRKIMDISMKEIHQKGTFLFREGDPACYFYILLTGCVKLSITESGRVIYTVNHSGEAFGWSSLIRRASYSASAECVGETKLLSINNENFLSIIRDDPESGLAFFERLAGALGERLLLSYRMGTGSYTAAMSASFGTGQMLEPFISA